MKIMGHHKDLLNSRAIVKPGLWALIPKDGLVNNTIPNIIGCKISIVASPKMGASFVQYILDAEKGGKTITPFASENNTEAFVYIIGGEISINTGNTHALLKSGGFAFIPPELSLDFTVKSENAEILLYKQKFLPYSDLKPYKVIGNINEIPFRNYDGMDNVFIKDFLPTDNLAFDMNMHVLSFLPGGCHPFVETHVQEHGAYILKGKGVYYMDNEWIEIKKDDFMWFGPYCPQGAYGVGTEAFEYIYSKDCNRDVFL